MKCFVEPVRVSLADESTLCATVRGIQCDPKAPACKDWRWIRDSKITLDNVSLSDLLKAYGEVTQPCCGNCYFSHEV